MALKPATSPFVWGRNGQQLTPDQVERLRESADAAALRGVDYSPVSHWSQGMARLVDAWGGYKGRQRADAQDAAGMAGADDTVRQAGSRIAELLGVPQAQSAAPAGFSTPPAPATVPEALAATPQAGGFPASLIQSESGGNWNALNSEGYGGRLQFGDARLADAAAAGIIPAGMTGAEFSRLPPEQQEAVEQWHFADIDRQAAGRGLNSFIGQTVGGIPITQNAIRAMAHLGGIGGAGKFLQSGGAYNPGDSNGTRLSDYASRHGGGSGMSVPEALAQDPSVMPALALAAADPWVRRKYGPVVEALMQQELKKQEAQFQQQLAQQDPMYRAQLEHQMMQNEALRNPEPPKPIEVGGVLVDPVTYQPLFDSRTPEGSYRVISGEEAAAMGLPPDGAYNIGPDGKVTQIGGNGTNVSVNVGGEGAPGLGKLSTDFGYVLDPETGMPVIDPNTGLPTAAPVPGSPAARGMAEADAMRADQSEQGQRYGRIVLEDIGHILDAVESSPGLVSGPLGSLMSRIPGTAAHDVSSLLGTIRANVGFDRLQAMRAASPTGGALGAVSDSENKMLQATLGALEQSQTPAQFARNLRRLQNLYTEIVHGAAPDGMSDDEWATQAWGGQAQQYPGARGVPEGIDPGDWEALTPEERALWQ